MTRASSVIDDWDLGATLGEAVLSLQGDALDEELNRIVRLVFDDYAASYSHIRPDTYPETDARWQHVSAENFYVISGKNGQYNEADLQKLNVLAGLTARLFATRARLDKVQQESARAQLRQNQILEQIHESVITMDLAGFILSWNRGAEKMFGYSSQEVIGKNILFLYDDEDAEASGLFDAFLEHGGREMEVLRRKKSGEVFWASLSLSSLCDQDGQAVGIIGYLSDITQRKEAEKKINRLAYYDSLTSLPNRSLFKQLVDNALLQSQRSNSVGALLFVDLNRFKPINDTLGHHIGDLLLVQVAEKFRLALRENDIVSRLGSDEFAIALLDINQHYHAILVVQKLLAVMDGLFLVEGHELRLGASIGISIFPQDGQDADTLLQKADIAMYKAKRSNDSAAGSYVFYNQNMNQSVAGRLYLESGMRRALDQQEFFVLYQPKVDILSGKMIGVEALLRWNHPDKGIVPPSEFIPVAEETGLILRLDAWVLETACQQAHIWQMQNVTPFRIAVNVSAREFTANFPERIKAVLSKYQISPAWLEVEITESMLMHSAESVIAIMEEITNQGVSLALDDFGTGYSSLSYLKRFPIETLKIDRSFIMGTPNDHNDNAITKAIIMMAKQLKLKVIAEGVETIQQLEFLREAGCDEVQGYFFSKPIAPELILPLLNKDFQSQS
ncbi:putative bifunctional diguanylate cyclase/phosphodiesterase [Undibacterium sp. SXout7W]|uniref:putative bifunctional diguanylate cyclase/phosphodiesterase n=1 Tax=Undibacterium sp. SXout7W TaxID=3413049 RepID=UPI003BF2A2B2